MTMGYTHTFDQLTTVVAARSPASCCCFVCWKQATNHPPYNPSWDSTQMGKCLPSFLRDTLSPHFPPQGSISAWGLRVYEE